MLSSLVVLYLYLGGLSAGICVVLGILGLMVPHSVLAIEEQGLPTAGFLQYDPRVPIRWVVRVPDVLKQYLTPGYGFAIICLLVGVCCLVIDLGRLDRAINFILSPRIAYITIGAYALVLLMATAVALGLVFSRVVHRWPLWVVRGLQALSVVLGLVVCLYTGLLLASMPSVPLWNIWCVPALFVLSAFSCGVASLLVVSRLLQPMEYFPRVTRRLVQWDVLFIVCELAVLVAYYLLLPCVWPPDTATGVAAAQSLALLFGGENSLLFTVGYIGCGLVLPLALMVTVAILLPRVDVSIKPLVMGASALVAIGGFLMRWCIVMAGMQPESMLLF